MVATRLGQADNYRTPRQTKGDPTASTSSTIGDTNYGTIQWDGQDWIDIGNSPSTGLVLAWTHASGATLSIRCWISNDSVGTVATKAPYVPSQTTGTTPAYPQVITFAKADWVEGAATVTYCPITLDTRGFRFIKIERKSDNASGSVIAHAAIGTGG